MRISRLLGIASMIAIAAACGPSSREIAAEQRRARYKAESDASSNRLQAQFAAQSLALAESRNRVLEAELAAARKREEDSKRLTAQTPKRDPLADLRARMKAKESAPSIPDPQASPDAKAIDAEVSKIMEAEHGKLPPAQKIQANTSGVASIQIKNRTEHTLTVLYSGKTSKKSVLAPYETNFVTVAAGLYAVAASVDAAGVLPFAGKDTLSGGSYSNEFYIKTSFR